MLGWKCGAEGGGGAGGGRGSRLPCDDVEVLFTDTLGKRGRHSRDLIYKMCFIC